MEETIQTLATATDSDSSGYNDNFYSINDMYVLHFAFILLMVGLVTKCMVRKMYINLIGGRKGE